MILTTGFKVLSSDYLEDEYGGFSEQSFVKYESDGYLDLVSGTNEHSIHNAKTEESTHILICDWFEDYLTINDKDYIVANGKKYSITYLDNPMEQNNHLEIYLNYVGDNHE